MTDKIQYLVELGERLRSSPEFQNKVQTAVQKNSWFIPEFVSYATEAIIREMLNEAKLRQWLGRYQSNLLQNSSIPSPSERGRGEDHQGNSEGGPLKPVDKTIGLIFAGNLPLVGFHDVLCCYLTGCRMKIRLSSKDDDLFPTLLNILFAIDKELSAKVELVEQLKDFDAVIATGSNNTNRYFEYYFRHHPKILRRSRNSVAILTGRETPAELERLADDIFLYFGFGCRNVSKLYLPAGYDVTGIFPHFNKYQWLIQNNKYMNNYDYNSTLLMLNKSQFLTNNFVILEPNSSIPSPVSIVHYEFWNDEASLIADLKENSENIQCTVGNTSNMSGAFRTSGISLVPFGQSQHPELWDYADGVDTLHFLLGL